MMRSLFTAATGMESQQVTIDTISNNLANVNTTAFKRSRANFHDLLYQTLKAPGQNSTAGTVVPTGIQIGAGSRISSVEKMFNEGAIRVTNKTTDLMIEGQGFFRVQKDDGTIAFTRDGSFKIDNTGRLVTAEGFPLVPEIVVPENVTFASALKPRISVRSCWRISSIQPASNRWDATCTPTLLPAVSPFRVSRIPRVSVALDRANWKPRT
jgi:flagellar hook-basal body protein